MFDSFYFINNELKLEDLVFLKNFIGLANKVRNIETFSQFG